MTADLESGARQRRSIWTRIGLCLSGAVLLVLVATVIWLWPANLTLSDAGTFLGGGAATLAFIWIVIGYLQQNEKLQINTRALIEQIKEMKESVEEQKRQTTSFQRQTDALQLSEAHARRDTILKLIDIYVGRLAGFASIVANHLRGLGPALVTTGWANYSGGDRDYFFRVILPGNQPPEHLVGPLTDGMGRSNELVDAIYYYIETYDRFVSHVRPLDPDSAFLPLYENGYVGHVYRALKLVEQAVQRAPVRN